MISLIIILSIFNIIFIIINKYNIYNKKITITPPSNYINFIENTTIYNNYKLMNFTGGGIRALVALYYIKNHYNDFIKIEKDIFNNINGFSGISTGAIVSLFLCYRIKIIDNLIQNNPDLLNNIFNYFNYEETIINDINNGKINYSIIILDILIYIYEFYFPTHIIKKKYNLNGIFGPKYCIKSYIKIFNTFLKNIRFQDSTQHFFILTQNTVTNNLILINNMSSNSQKFINKLWIIEVILMSTSSPLFISNYKNYIDPGLLNNDAIYYSVLEIKKHLNIYPKIISFSYHQKNSNINFFNKIGIFKFFSYLINVYYNHSANETYNFKKQYQILDSTNKYLLFRFDLNTFMDNINDYNNIKLKSNSLILNQEEKNLLKEILI